MTSLGFRPGVLNENTNAAPHGVDGAQQLSSAVDALRSEPSTAAVSVTHNLAFGLENYGVCGAGFPQPF